MQREIFVWEEPQFAYAENDEEEDEEDEEDEDEW